VEFTEAVPFIAQETQRDGGKIDGSLGTIPRSAL
jgi:hypothetical protein